MTTVTDRSKGYFVGESCSLLDLDTPVDTIGLSDIIDADAIQPLMDDFYQLTHIGVALVDLEGNVLVASGWQDICTLYHRVHAVTRNHCLESDLVLSNDVPAGTFRLYRCKNNMWDIATPIMVSDTKVGNLFLGQFFFDDEMPDIEVFRRRAQQYGFDEHGYLAALEKVPRWSRQTVERVMAFYTKFAGLVSSMGYSRLQLNRMLAEEGALLDQLRQSEEKYRILTDNAAEAIFVVQDGRLKFANPQTEKISGYARQELVSRPFVDFIHPEDRALVYEDYTQRLQGMDVPESYVFRIVNSSGESRWVELRATGIDWEGKPATLNLLTDVTDRQLAEGQLNLAAQRLALATKSVGIGIWDWDLATGSLVWDDRMFEIHGIGPEDFGGHEAWKRLVHPEDLPVLFDVIQKTIDGQNPQSCEFRIIRPDGQVRYIECDALVFRAPDGAPKRVIGVNNDITPRKDLETQFIQSQKMEAIGRLAGGIAHDFNNLLVPISGYAELGLLTLSPDDSLYSNLTHIKTAADRAADLTRQILAFSRQQVLKMEVIDLNRVIQEFNAMLQRLIGEDIQLSTRLAADLGKIKGDKGQLGQVLLNLAVNARDAMPDGGTLTIETADVLVDETHHAGSCPGLASGRYVLLTVTDNGHGIDAATCERIFEPFFTTKERGHGTGLGLATVFGIVKQHQGTITVHSQPGQGTAFKTYLPIEESPLSSEASAPLPAAVPTVGGSQTVLLVEDDSKVRHMVYETLHHYGYHVLLAEDPDRAISLCRDHDGPIHLMLTDVILPQMKGTELYHRLAPQRSEMFVLFMSGYSDSTLGDLGIFNQGQAFIQKPFSIRQLLQKINLVLETATDHCPAAEHPV